MSNSPQEQGGALLEVSTGGEENNPEHQAKFSLQTVATCCCDNHYRRLAHASIICGCSCIGIRALEHSFKAEWKTDQRTAYHSRKARNLSIISIITLVGILLLILLLTFFISYLITIVE